MAFYKLPDQPYLLECFIYDPDTGSLTWRDRPISHFRSKHAWITWNAVTGGGAVAGKPHQAGHLKVWLDGRKYFVHRIIFKLMTGEDPPADIDHRNFCPADNAWTNLRPASRQENNRNKSVTKASRTGLKGVNARRGSFWAYIRIDGRQVHLGRFSTKEAAHAAYCEAAARLHGFFFRPP